MITKAERNIIFIAVAVCLVIIVFNYFKLVQDTQLEILLAPFIVIVLLLSGDSVLLLIRYVLIKGFRKSHRLVKVIKQPQRLFRRVN